MFKIIIDNEYRKLEKLLSDLGQNINVVEMQESRRYSALAFCAFKNHNHCFKLILNHGIKYNLKKNINSEPLESELKYWADM